jgi:hypothetical protein
VISIESLRWLYKTCDSVEFYFHDKSESDARGIVSAFGEPEYCEAREADRDVKWFATERGRLSITAFIKSPESGDSTEEQEK